jgi:hypothetical protein
MDPPMKFRILALPLALAALSQGCASSAQNKALDQKVAEQQDVTSNRSLEKKQNELLSHVSNLNEGQRAKLAALRDSSHNKLAAIQAESVKVRAVLIRELLAEKPSSKEVSAAKKRLKKLSDDRLDTIFDAANQTNEIIGRNGMLRDAMDIQFLEDNFNTY